MRVDAGVQTPPEGRELSRLFHKINKKKHKESTADSAYYGGPC